MNKIIPLLLLCASFTACTDSDYDLKHVTTDNATIGDDNSVYELPLAKVNISLSQMSDGTAQIDAMFKQANIWLPTAVTQVDIEKLTTNNIYRNELIGQTIDEMKSSQGEAKRNAVIQHTWDNYRQEFASMMGSPTTLEAYSTAFTTVLATNSSVLDDQINSIATDYLKKIDIEELSYEIKDVNVDSDIVDMLANNLDPEGTPGAKNTLHIYGTISSGLPIAIRLDPIIEVSRQIGFTVTTAPGQMGEIPPTQIYEQDLRQILAGTTIRIPVALLTYYPQQEFESTQQINIQLALRKKGGLKFDI